MEDLNLRTSPGIAATSKTENPSASLGTLEIADQMKIDQGDHELEVSSGGEADLHKHKRRCKKNPGHPNFIPLSDFRPEHLPLTYRTPEVFEDLCIHAKLTVRLTVKFISTNRPLIFPSNSAPFPFHNFRGKTVHMTGTGWVDRVYTRRVIRGRIRCPCQSCTGSDRESRPLPKLIRIITASHVVFDSIEAGNTEVELFYDSDSDKSKVKKLYCYEARAYMEEDCSRIVCVTHDTELVNELEKMLDRRNEIHMKVFDQFRNAESHLAVVISHPHGCNKQISIGYWKKKTQVDRRRTSYTYTTATCPGSSGGPVWILGREGNWANVTHPHSKGLKSGLNESAAGYDYMAFSIK